MRRLALLAILLLAGCVSEADPSATVNVQFPDGTSVSHERTFDPAGRPAQHMYQLQGQEHPGNYTVHDLLYELNEEGVLAATFQYFSFGDGGGFFVCSLGGQPAPEDGGCPQDAGGYYEFRISGEAAKEGISDVEVERGLTYAFVWKTF